MELRISSTVMAWSVTVFWFLVFAVCGEDAKIAAQRLCMPEHPQQQFCRSDFVVRGKILGRLSMSDRVDEGGHDIAPLDIEDGVTAYIVKVERIYKGDGEMGLHRHVEAMMLRHDKGCGLPRLRKGHVYIITGTWDETGRYNVGACDWVIEYADLTKMQKQGVRYLYRQYCDTCQISLCFSGNCKQQSTSMCHWDLSGLRYDDDDCEAKHSRCIRFGNGNCGWYRSFNLKGCYRNRMLMRQNRVKKAAKS
ncbi:metalloproteinase inhibitor 3-like [Diadema antillarum]|uniref:metalloproteinase inhibitor 3-like n=1 Tax=Diadema antillarum TaxID=105358 RepID=UPI003A8354CB